MEGIWSQMREEDLGFLGGLVVKNQPANVGDIRDTGSIPGWGRSPGGGHGNPLQYSCLENPIVREARQATVHGFTKSQTRLSTEHAWDRRKWQIYLQSLEYFHSWRSIHWLSSCQACLGVNGRFHTVWIPQGRVPLHLLASFKNQWVFNHLFLGVSLFICFSQQKRFRAGEVWK